MSRNSRGSANGQGRLYNRYLAQIFYYLRVGAPVLLFLSGVVLLYIFISLAFWSVVGPIFGIAIGGGIGIVGVLFKRFHTTAREPSRKIVESLDERIPIILACLYATITIILFRFHTYTRPNLLYPLFGGFAGLIAYQIARGGSGRSIIIQILSISFFTYWSSQFLFPAGMAGPDTLHGYLPGMRHIFETGQILSKQTIYAGHLAFAAEFSLITGLSAQTGYFFLATLLLAGTVLVIAILDRIFPTITHRGALYATLIFATSSWMLGRGMHPNKLNYFYALILLLGGTTVLIYRNIDLIPQTRKRALIGVLLMPALIFGHQFSAGAAMIFLFVVGAFAIVTYWISPSDYGPASSVSTFLTIILIYVLGIFGNPLHQGPLLDRFAGLLLSVVVSAETGSATGGPGRYSELGLNVLVASTAAQTLLFALAVLGAIWMFRQRNWEYDLVITWIGAISLLLVVSLLTNSVDTAPQRFYGLLILFGFNICVSALFLIIDRRGVFDNGSITINGGRLAVVLLMCLFATASLGSPVADKATSPVADDLPHFRQFETHQEIQGDQWLQTYGVDPVVLTSPNSPVLIQRTGPHTGELDLTGVDRGTIVAYSNLSNRTGMISGEGLSLGGRQFVFVGSPAQPTDSHVYSNGQTIVFVIRR